MVREGELVELDRGAHLLANAGQAPVRLIWGSETRQPGFAPPARPYWTDF